MKKKLIRIAALGLAFSMLCIGCGNSGKSEGTQEENKKSEAADSDEPLKVSIAAQATSGQVFQYLAEERNYLEEEGIEVEVQYISNGTDAFSALSAGKVDILSTYGTGGPLMQIANGQDFNIFGGYMITGETPVFALPDTEYKDIESFRGKKIGITRGGTPDIVLKSILHDAGFDIEKDVTFVEFKKNTDTMAAVANGEIDFGAVATGYELQIAEMGMEVKMWPDDLYKNHSCCRMVATNEWLADETNQEAAKRLIKAYLRAERDMTDDAVVDEVCKLTSEELDIQPEVVDSFVKSPHMIYETDPFIQKVVQMWNNMDSFGYLSADVDLKEHVNSDIYKAALDELIEENPDDSFYQEREEFYVKYDTNIDWNLKGISDEF
jgi:NitT/TauT family transport system substrate-binding protein